MTSETHFSCRFTQQTSNHVPRLDCPSVSFETLNRVALQPSSRKGFFHGLAGAIRQANETVHTRPIKEAKSYVSAADEGGRRVAQNGIGPAVGLAGCQKAVLEEQSGWSGERFE